MIIAQQKNILKAYFFITYLVILWLVSDSLSYSTAYSESLLTFSFMVIAFLLYGLFYLLPAIAITAIVQWLSNRLKSNSSRATYVAAVLTGAITTLLLYANAKIYALYGMFFNGFLINLVMTPGGIESLGGSRASDLGFALITLGFLSLQALILWSAHRYYTKKTGSAFQFSFKFLPATAIIVGILVHMGFALDSYTSNQLNVVAESIPFYQTVSARGFFKKLGFTTHRETKFKVKGKLNYPLNPLQFTRPAKPYNVIWLTSES